MCSRVGRKWLISREPACSDGSCWGCPGPAWGKCQEPQSSKAKQSTRALCRVFHSCTAQNVQLESAELHKMGSLCDFHEMLLRNVRSLFSAKLWCVPVNMSAQPVLLNKPEHVSRLLNIPLCRGPGSCREGSGRECELNTSGVLTVAVPQCRAPSLPLEPLLALVCPSCCFQM